MLVGGGEGEFSADFRNTVSHEGSTIQTRSRLYHTKHLAAQQPCKLCPHLTKENKVELAVRALLSYTPSHARLGMVGKLATLVHTKRAGSMAGSVVYRSSPRMGHAQSPMNITASKVRARGGVKQLSYVKRGQGCRLVPKWSHARKHMSRHGGRLHHPSPTFQKGAPPRAQILCAFFLVGPVWGSEVGRVG